MKKLLLTFGILFSLFALPTQAEQIRQDIPLTRGNPSNPTIGTKLHRSPVMLPSVELVYDSDNNSFEILCSSDCDAEVTVYDSSGTIIAISDIKATISLPSSNHGHYTITIVADYWYGTAEIIH